MSRTALTSGISVALGAIYFYPIKNQHESIRYPLMAMTLTIGSCWASIAIMFLTQNDGPLWQLTLCAMVTMAHNAAAIAVAPMRAVIYTFILSIGVNAAILFMNLA